MVGRNRQLVHRDIPSAAVKERSIRLVWSSLQVVRLTAFEGSLMELLPTHAGATKLISYLS